MKDRTFILAIVLSIFGIAAQFLFGRSFVRNQIMFVLIGILAYGFITRFVHARLLISHIHTISAAGICLLFALLLIGTPIRGSRRWFSVFTFGFQPSIFFTPFFTLSLAHILNTKKIRSLLDFVSIVLLILIPVFLVFKQPDLGTSILIFITLTSVVLYSNISPLYLITSVALIVPVVLLLPNVLHGYQLNRIISFLNPTMDPYGINYNSLQALVAIGSGGFMGKGLLHASQSQLHFLPEAHTDFVFAAFTEAFGFVGGLLIIVLAFFLLYSLISSLSTSKRTTSSLYIMGIFTYIFIQFAFNIGMNMRLFPVVGVPLPFISSGGTALITLFIALALHRKIKEL